MQLKFGIKYWTSNPVWVRFQEHGISFYVNIEEKVWLLVKKNTDLKRLTGRLKLCFLTEIGRFHWNQGERVAHFAWFGEPCVISKCQYSFIVLLKREKCIWNIKYAFDSDTTVQHKDELIGLGCFILIDILLNKTNMK